MKNKKDFLVVGAFFVAIILVIFSIKPLKNYFNPASAIQSQQAILPARGVPTTGIHARTVDFSKIAQVSKGATKDTIPPKVQIISPKNDQLVSGQVSLAVNASDQGSGIKRVEYYINDTSAGKSMVFPYSILLNTQSYRNGIYSLSAKVIDNAGNTTVSRTVTVSVNNVVSTKNNRKNNIPNIPSTSALNVSFGDADGEQLECDCTIAVGLSHVVAVTNTPNNLGGNEINVYAKGSNIPLGAKLSALFSAPAGNPKILYDEESDKFILSATDISTKKYVYLAVSQTGDPTASWYTYTIPFAYDMSNYVHIARLGINADMIALSLQTTSSSTYNSQNFAHILVYDKTMAMSGTLAGSQFYWTLPGLNWLNAEVMPAPAHTYDSNEKNLYLASWYLHSTTLHILAINGPANTATLSLLKPLSLPTAGSPETYALAAEPVASYYVNTFQTPIIYKPFDTTGIEDPVFRNGSLYITSHELVSPTTSDRDLVYWGQIDMSKIASGGDPALFQDGVVVDLSPTNATSYYFPTLSVDACSDVGIGFSGSSALSEPSALYVSRSVSDPLGTMSPVSVAKQGTASYNGAIGDRWGNWSGTAVDPVDNSFWTFQEYMDSSTPDTYWSSWIHQFTPKFPTIKSDLTWDGSCLASMSGPATCGGMLTLTSYVKNFCQPVGKVDFLVDGNIVKTLPGDPTLVASGDPNASNPTFLGYPYSYAWDTSSVANGLHTLTVNVYDTSGSAVPDSTNSLQVISSNGGTDPYAVVPTVSSITSTSAVITWTTATPSTSEVWLSTTGGASYTQVNPFSNSFYVTSHSFTVTGLLPNTEYYYSVMSYEQLTYNQYHSGTKTFTTSGPNVVPTVINPTATPTAPTKATLGAEVSSLGIPAVISARGTCWGTTPAPTTNCIAEGGTTTGVFTQARTGLTKGVTYYTRGYATNATGTGYSPDLMFVQ